MDAAGERRSSLRDDQADRHVNQSVQTYRLDSATYGYHTRSGTAVIARTSELIITTAAAAAGKLTEQPSSYGQTLQLRISAVSTAHFQTACRYPIFQPAAAALSVHNSLPRSTSTIFVQLALARRFANLDVVTLVHTGK